LWPILVGLSSEVSLAFGGSRVIIDAKDYLTYKMVTCNGKISAQLVLNWKFQNILKFIIMLMVLLPRRRCSYIINKTEHWQPSCALNVSDMSVEFGKLKLVLGFGHTMNYQNYGEKMTRKGQLILELKRHLEELGIEYYHPVQQLAVNLTSNTSPAHGS
jgi:hypothetical protein